ncbi:putative Heat shock protein Hsp20 [Magnetospirillum sp. LM-5]|uniref:Hsp20/alpha crystallin family protein n=1 Tax=Magnetospirillum sp. LM-5 TaxID=2681466 RepID=UPI0013801223|nr:Hsp20/alpha crystallin family protein [Magnetospirillum sp. LM-5]CAA7615085.1 putative Heat shock protein Hsp20 [Magnetospirillum sp. LM-5]
MTGRVIRRPPRSDSPAESTPSHPLQGWHGEVDRLFEGFFPAALGGSSQTAFGRALHELDSWLCRPLQGFDQPVPSVDIRELADCYQITTELPGLDAQDVDVTVKDGVLMIHGEKTVERGIDRFERLFRLPEDADAEGIGAEFATGILTITVPKHEKDAVRDRKIAVKPH